MRLRDDERGQSIQVGAVLLFGILIISFSTYQAAIVPDQNRGVEFEHSLTVQNQLQDFRNAVVSMVGGGTDTSTSVQLGTTYPPRAVAMNPAPPSGRLRTVGTTNDDVNVTIRNGEASGETGDFWDGDPRNYSTGVVTYSPGYNVYSDAPTTVYGHSVLYNQVDGGIVPLTDQAIANDEISIIAVDGSLDRSSTGTMSVDSRPVSASERKVTLSPETDGNPIEVTLPTRLSVDAWNDLLDERPNVTAVPSSRTYPGEFEAVTLELTGDSHRLQLTKVGVGSGVTDENEAYLTDVEGDGETVDPGEETDLVLEVRDAYNNPVPEVDVDAEVDGSNAGSLSPNSATSDEDGRVTFTYEASGSTDEDDREVRFSLDTVDGDFDASSAEDASMTVTVTDAGNGGSDEPDGAYGVTWLDPSGQSNVDCSSDPCEFDAADSGTAEMTMETDPTAVGANVDYAVSNETVGDVAPGEGETNATGHHGTTLTISQSGEINVYVASGGAGDVLAFNVSGISGSDLETVAYVDGDSGDLNTVSSDGSVTTYVTGEDVRAIGSIADLDDDGRDEVPYVTNGNELRIVDDEGSTETLATDVAHSEATIGVGDGDDDGNVEVYYTDSGDNHLHEVESGGTPQRIERTNGNSCNGAPSPIQTPNGVAGVADFNDDGTLNVVFTSNAQQVAYFDTGECEVTYPGAPASGIASGNGGVGIGEPFEYGPGDVRVPVVDGSNDLVLVESDGSTTTLSSSDGNAAPSPLTVRDWDGDGDLEVVYLDGSSSPYVLRLAGIEDTDLDTIRDDNGDDVTGERASGAR